MYKLGIYGYDLYPHQNLTFFLDAYLRSNSWYTTAFPCLCIYNPSNKKNKEFYVGIHTVGHKSQVSKTWQMSQLQSFVTEFLKRLLLVRCLNNYLIFYFLIVT